MLQGGATATATAQALATALGSGNTQANAAAIATAFAAGGSQATAFAAAIASANASGNASAVAQAVASECLWLWPIFSADCLHIDGVKACEACDVRDNPISNLALLCQPLPPAIKQGFEDLARKSMAIPECMSWRSCVLRYRRWRGACMIWLAGYAVCVSTQNR